MDSKDPSALLDWLKKNDFVAPSGASNVVAGYVKDGWVFSVAKLNRENIDRGTNAIHPLSFTFKTSKPIYPMRLTGVGSKSLRVELYVFGGVEQARAKYFKLEQCAPITAKATRVPGRKNELSLSHPFLKQWLTGSAVVTKLSADLAPAQMMEDVQIDWRPYSEYRQTIFSYEGAATIAADWSAVLMLGALLVIWIWAALSRWHQTLERTAVQLLGFGAVVFLICFFVVPKVSVRTSLMPWIRAVKNVEFIGELVEAQWNREKPKNLIDARRIAADLIKSIEPNERENFLMGGSIREEDSPGNYMIRQGTNGFEFVWFAADGSEQSFDR